MYHLSYIVNVENKNIKPPCYKLPFRLPWHICAISRLKSLLPILHVHILHPPPFIRPFFFLLAWKSFIKPGALLVTSVNPTCSSLSLCSSYFLVDSRSWSLIIHNPVIAAVWSGLKWVANWQPHEWRPILLVHLLHSPPARPAPSESVMNIRVVWKGMNEQD